MFIMMVSPECAPVAKVGGLGDVIHGLARELALRGNFVEVVLPMYDCMRYDRIWGLTKSYADLWVPWHGGQIRCDVFFGVVDDIKCFFIKPYSHEAFFDRGAYYGNKDDAERFAFFSRAALEFMLKAGKHPDIIHCHDWQTGLVPVLLYEVYQHVGMSHPRVCYTLHNIAHQGWTGEHVLRMAGLDPARLLNRDRLADDQRHGAVNLMKGGIVYSNFVTTVSNRYAEEVKWTSFGEGLQHTLQVHAGKFGGVLNGIDYNVWNPELDSHIPQRYSAETLEDKFRNKEALRERLLLQDTFKPIVAVVSRLDPQKGVDLIHHAIFYALANGCQFVLLGSSPRQEINDHFRHLKEHLNDNPDCHLELGYDEELSHLIYAGAEMIVIPSTFEPCGLTQMIALRYGTVPIVRATGGLADTVFDANHSDRPYEARNGYTFEHADRAGLESAMGRAIGMWYSYPEHFHQLQVNGMRQDNSWNHPGSHYVNIYDYIRE